MILLIVSSIGFNVINNQKDVSIKRIKSSIEHETKGIKNLIIYRIEEFRGGRLVLYSYDLGDDHYISCRHLEKNYILGGGGGPVKVDKRQPFSITSFGVDPDKYVISYGEIYNKDIASIEIVYSNGEKKIVKNQNQAFLATTNKSINVLKTVTAYDSSGKVIHHLP